MKPVRLLIVLACVNLAFIGIAFNFFIKPNTVNSLDMVEVSVQQPSPAENLVYGTPSRLTINTIDLDIAVEDGEYDSYTHEWTLKKDVAHYATMTAPANNQAGNTFIYGHNNKLVFGKLDRTSIGDIAEVHTEKGKFIYELSSIKEVEPTDLSVFEYRGGSVLTVQTCSGSWYEKRKLFEFRFLSYQETGA